MPIPILRKPVGCSRTFLQILDGGCINDLAFVDHRGVAGKTKTEMHVVLCRPRGKDGQP
jgi:hypothetical protein